MSAMFKNLSFQEKSLWLILISLVVCFGWYFNQALRIQTEQVFAPHIALFVVMMVFLVVVQIVGNTVFAIAHRRELERGVQSDERDKLIRWKSNSHASYLLAVGVFLSLCVALFVPGNYVFMHVLLAFWVASQILALALQLYYYQRGC